MGTSLGGRVELVEQEDKEAYEGASEIFTFRGYQGGIPALVLVRLQNGVMRSFVAEDMDDMSNSDDDNDFQDPPGAAAAAAADQQPKKRSKMKLWARSTNVATPTETAAKRQKTATLAPVGRGAQADMTAKQRRLGGQHEAGWARPSPLRCQHMLRFGRRGTPTACGQR